MTRQGPVCSGQKMGILFGRGLGANKTSPVYSQPRGRWGADEPMSESTEDKKKLGELLVASGLVSAEKLPESLEYAKEHRMPLGRVLIQWRLLKEADLESALHSQALMKIDRLPTSLAVKAITLSAQDNLSIESALKRLGWQVDRVPGAEAHEVSLAKEKLATAGSAFGSRHPETALAAANLADVLVRHEEYAEAEKFYTQAMTVVEACFGKSSKEMSALLPRVAELYCVQDRFAEAEETLWKNYEIKEALLGSEHLEVARCLEDLAELYDAQSEYLQAERFYLSSIGIKDKHLDEEDPELLNSLKKLIFVSKQRERQPLSKATGELLVDAGMLKQDKLEEALGLAREYHLPLGRALINMQALSDGDLQKVLQAQVMIKDGTLPAYLVIRSLKIACKYGISIEQALKNIGWKKENSAEHKQLERLLKASDMLVTSEKTAGADHPDVAIACVDLADLYAGAGNLKEAEALIKRAQAIFEQHHGKDHLTTAGALFNLAEVYLRQGKFADAEELLVRVLAIRSAQLGDRHNETAEAYELLGKLKMALKDHEAAIKSLETALAIKQKLLGIDQPQIAALIETIGDAKLAAGNFEAAFASYQKALTIREKSLSSGNPQVTGLLNKMGALYVSKEEPATALKYFERAEELTETMFGAAHPLVALALMNLAECTAKMANYQKATEYYKRAIQVMESVAGPDHEETATVLERYSEFLKRTGMHEEAAKVDKRVGSIRSSLGSRRTVVALKPLGVIDEEE